MDYAGETSPVRKVIQLMPSRRAWQDFHGMEAPQWNSMDGCFFSKDLVAQFMETSRNHETSYIVSSTAPNIKLIRLVLVSSVEFMLSHNLCHSWPVTSCVARDHGLHARQNMVSQGEKEMQDEKAGTKRKCGTMAISSWYCGRGKLLDSSVTICTQLRPRLKGFAAYQDCFVLISLVLLCFFEIFLPPGPRFSGVVSDG